MIDPLLRINPRMTKLKAADLVDNSFVEQLRNPVTINEAKKRSR